MMADMTPSSPRLVSDVDFFQGLLTAAENFDSRVSAAGVSVTAAYIDTDMDGRLYRSFGYLGSPLLLHSQDQLMCIEKELAELGQGDEKRDLYCLCFRRYDEEDPTNCKQKQILDRLDTMLKDYDELVLREHAVVSLKRPWKRVHKGYFDYI
jgi:hypothetical protein